MIDIRVFVVPPNSVLPPNMATTADDPKVSSSTDETEEEPPPGWGSDDRISFSTAEGKYLLTEDDGSEMEWNAKYKAWMPVVRPPV